MAVPEVTSLRGILARRADLLRETTGEACQHDTEHFLQLLGEELLLHVVVESLEGYAVDFASWQAGLREHGPQLPDNERDRAAMCLAILKEYGLQGKPWLPSSEMTRLRSMDELTSHFYEVFLPPLVQYLDTQLQERAEGLAPESLMQEVVELVEKRPAAELSSAIQSLEQASRDLFASSGAASWRGVAGGCRESLQLLATAFYRPEMLPSGAAEPSTADYGRKLGAVIRHLMTCAGYGAEQEYISLREAMVASNWQLAENLEQLQAISLADAKYCLLGTYLTIADFARLSQTA